MLVVLVLVVVFVMVMVVVVVLLDMVGGRERGESGDCVRERNDISLLDFLSSPLLLILPIRGIQAHRFPVRPEALNFETL